MLIGISGKIGSGKDTVGKIIQIITQSPHFNDDAVIKFLERDLIKPKFVNKKFADTLKDFVCMLLGCTREQLENREFKEKELGEEWWYYTNTLFEGSNKILKPYIGASKKLQDNLSWYIYKLTPRKLLQLMGTECGREILHPNIWVNALMSKYVSVKIKDDLLSQKTKESSEKLWKIGHLGESKWIISDMRFPNELKAVKSRGGLTIRVNRTKIEPGRMIIMDMSTEDRSKDVVLEEKEHESETALDNAVFDYTIENDGTIKDLVEMIKQILKKEKLI